MGLNDFNSWPAERATAALTACCDAPGWVAAVRDGRPYADLAEVLDAADKAARELDRAAVERALASHPRIGERAPGSTTEATWSRQEQSALGADARVERALLAANLAYEERFGRVFLVCATGLTGEEILARLHDRLANDEAGEAAVVGDELRKIALLRLKKVIGP